MTTLSVLFVIIGGVTTLVVKVIQRQQWEETENKLLVQLQKVFIYQREMDNSHLGSSECNESKQGLPEAEQELKDFQSAHPNAVADLPGYLGITGLNQNKQFLIQHGLIPDVEAQKRKQELNAELQAASSLWIPGMTFPKKNVPQEKPRN